MNRRFIRRIAAQLAPLTIAACAFAAPAGDGHEVDLDAPRPHFPDEPIPLKLEEFPDRPEPILELGEPFLGTGEIGEGFEIPTGAVWRPSLLIFGTYRSALQTYDDGETTFTEWANNLDIFANLQLSGTERILFGMRPLENNGQFVGYHFHPDEDDGWQTQGSDRITHLYFEGDIGEIFPGLDPADTDSLDWGFSVGRQPISFQEGMLINDTLDAVGVTRNTLLFDEGSDIRTTFLYAWDDIDRDHNRSAGSADLFGLFNEIDVPDTTINLDAIYVHDPDNRRDSIHLAASAVQRIGKLNTAFRILNSAAIHEDTAAARDGTLLFGEVSWTPPHTDNIAYVNGFLGIDEFSSAARDPLVGGPLGRVGVLYEAVGLGRYGAALGNEPDDSWGVAVGYQMFFDEKRRQLVLEVGGRNDIDGSDSGAIAAGMSLQQALGRRTIIRTDAFAAAHEHDGPSYGLRVELLIKF